MKKRRSGHRCGASAERARISLPPGGSCRRLLAVTEEECGRRSLGFECFKTCSHPLDVAFLFLSGTGTGKKEEWFALKKQKKVIICMVRYGFA